MYEPISPGGRKRRKRRWAGAAGLLAAGAIGGGVLASTLSASAASGTPTADASAVTSSSRPPGRPGPGGAHPVRSGEKSVPSATAATLRAAALRAVPGGTVYRIETDAGDGVYEVHMKKADGSLVTVKFDKKLKVTKVEKGMGAGDPGSMGHGAGAPGPAGQGAPGSPA